MTSRASHPYVLGIVIFKCGAYTIGIILRVSQWKFLNSWFWLVGISPASVARRCPKTPGSSARSQRSKPTHQSIQPLCCPSKRAHLRARFQRVQQISIPLHHGTALRQILRLVIASADLVLCSECASCRSMTSGRNPSSLHIVEKVPRAPWGLNRSE